MPRPGCPAQTSIEIFSVHPRLCIPGVQLGRAAWHKYDVGTCGFGFDQVPSFIAWVAVEIFASIELGRIDKDRHHDGSRCSDALAGCFDQSADDRRADSPSLAPRRQESDIRPARRWHRSWFAKRRATCLGQLNALVWLQPERPRWFRAVSKLCASVGNWRCRTSCAYALKAPRTVCARSA